ncbi:MAG: glycosyltransferase [Desulfobacula sp.]|nr:glycosyltransferase [Desulfobacula sp.]
MTYLVGNKGGQVLIKVLHIIDSFNVGGLENGLINIINSSQGVSLENEICCIRKSGSSEKRLNSPVPVFEMDKKQGNDPKLIFRLCKLIKKRKPDIVHTRNWGTVDGILAAKLAGVKTIIHGEHGWDIGDPNGMNIKRRIARGLLSFVIKKFVAVSDDIAQWLVKSCHVSPKKVQVIINGVDTDKFDYRTKPDDLKQKLGIDGKIVFGTVSRLDPIKQIDILIRAISSIKNQNCCVLVAGAGKERKNLEILAERYGVSREILFLGAIDRVDRIYNLMDVFLLISENEGISNTILEAMASGLPIIATRVGGNPELVNDMENGLLIEPKDVNAVVNALEFYIDHSDRRMKFSKMSRKKAVNHFALKKMVRNYVNLYKRLC